MSQSSGLPWGEWIKRRARHVGFHRQADLAAAVGCKRDRLIKWFAQATPTESMRKGFDAALAAALRTDKDTLFLGFVDIAPEAVPLLKPAPAPTAPPEDALRRKIGALVELLPPDKLRTFYDAGEAILHGRQLSQVA